MSAKGNPTMSSSFTKPSNGNTGVLSRIRISLNHQFPWIGENLRKPRSVKAFIRCWIASWLAFVLILPRGSLNILGSAGFFAAIASLMIPANMPIQTFVLAMTILIFGCLLGWAWGCAAMRAALTARDQATTLRKLQQMATLSAAEQQSRIFHGEFLDTRSTIAYGVFLGFAIFLLGYLRAKNAKLALPTIFASIFVDVICSYGPLFPVAQYTILNTFIISTAFYIAIGLFVIILIFPETLNHEWLAGYTEILGTIKELVDIQQDVLKVNLEHLNTDLENEGSIWNLVKTKEEHLIASLQALLGKTAMLPVEFSYGKLSGEDLQGLELPLKNLVTRTRGLQTFLSLLASHSEMRHKVNNDSGSDDDDSAGPGTHTPRSTQVRIKDTHRMLHLRRTALDQEIHHSLRVEDLLPILEDATQDLRSACSSSLQAAKESLEEINTQRYRRYIGRFSVYKLGQQTTGSKGQLGPGVDDEVGTGTKLLVALETLKSALQAYRTNHRLLILAPFSQLLESPYQVDSRGRPPFSLRPLFLCFVFQSNILWTAESLVSLLSYIRDAEDKRSTTRLWAPKGLSKLWGLMFRKDEDEREPLGNDMPPLDPFLRPGEEEEGLEQAFQKDPDSAPPTNFGQKVGNALHVTYKWLRTPEVMFATKNLVVTIALWLPAVIRPTAYFNFAEKGLWALIMAQMTLSVYMADQIVSYVGRIMGTIVGGAFGMVAWYIGSGRGKGNPYGLAASAALLLVPMVFYRLYGPVPMSAIMIAITAVLVVGYSWIDTQFATLGNAGVGWDVAWRRVLLVLVGSAASFILMLLPPQSRRKDVRISNASMITDISRLYAILLSSWLTDIEDRDLTTTPKPLNDGSAPQQDSVESYSTWAPAFRTRLIKVALRLQLLRQETAMAKWEGSLRGAWPVREYDGLLTAQIRMIDNLVQLASSLAQLSPSWRRTLLHRTAFLNPNLVADVMSVFGIVSMSLRTGEALHEVLPRSLVDRVFYHHSMASTRLAKQYDGPELSHHGDGILTPQALQSEEFAVYATGMAAVFQILLSLDELHRIVKVLCGEVPLKGFESWRDDFEMRQLGRQV